jgi:hypothetical protein
LLSIIINEFKSPDYEGATNCCQDNFIIFQKEGIWVVFTQQKWYATFKKVSLKLQDNAFIAAFSAKRKEVELEQEGTIYT